MEDLIIRFFPTVLPLLECNLIGERESWKDPVHGSLG